MVGIENLSLVLPDYSLSPLGSMGKPHRFAELSLAWIRVVVDVDQRPCGLLGHCADGNVIPASEAFEFCSVVT
jgi:hypothetical protein